MQDSTLFETIRSKLFTAVVGDVLDVMGYRAQFLPQAVKPLEPGTKLVGRAMPVLEADYPASRGSRGPLGDCAFGMMLEALDDLRNGEIYLATGGSHDYALWGGLMSARARHLGATGAILDGFVRDRAEIRALDFPVFARGTYAQDQAPRGKVIDFRVPLRVGQAMVEPGDLLFGDEEGIVVIPRAAEAEVIEAALAKAATENTVAAAIRGGMSAREAFATFGVL
jgi:regulator of RNase E activity RraA